MNARTDPYTIIAALRSENEILRWELEDIRARIAPPPTFPSAWRLAPIEARVLAAILAASPEVAAFERLILALYGDCEPMSAGNCISAFVVRVRRKLAAIGLPDVIRTEMRAGYRISAVARDRLLAVQAAENDRRAA